MELIPFTTKDLASFLEMSHDMYDSPAVAHPVSRDIFISTFRACLAGNQNVEGRMIVENGCTLGYLLLAHSFSSELGTSSRRREVSTSAGLFWNLFPPTIIIKSAR